MKIEDVMLFERIAALNSISAGGAACGLSATVSSDRLKRLEADLGCTLLNRTTRSLSLTDQGRRFLQHARDLLDQYEVARHSVGRMSDVPAGLLRVTAPSLFGMKFLPEVLSSFLTDYPETRLNINLSDEILNYTAEGIDVAIRIGKLKDSTLVVRKLGDSQRVLCASPSYIRCNGMLSHPSDLEQHNCIIFVGEHSWRLRNDQEDVRINVSGRFDTNSAEMATKAALDGLGIALRSLWDIAADLEAGRLVRVLPDYEVPSEMSIYAIYPPGRFVSPAAKAFVNMVDRHLSALEFQTPLAGSGYGK
ncbi:MAG: LysR substrate-binding domain-containing protein [Candidatus Thiodiazotropha taylori]|nr:LysR substrate-binding domain-containing protein [Candidatus Thiodiazotropha taylori]MCW4224029.1 LysR substrate-binding domain-containing protein [Candidatus Thiodiazotropha endolucinida]MCG7881721.1 LysR substrate-binding domain-containing protein [Candidatus Thiodiazotropha taylori]MCG7885606.1 LysR substrate-binding domain-containing protein [Candidatus Thiodiazotropha taylori]MCG7889611.1 LysR substrate-binding domain-containing protein [Candidatus Thiodiazotropha taylori]